MNKLTKQAKIVIRRLESLNLSVLAEVVRQLVVKSDEPSARKWISVDDELPEQRNLPRSRSVLIFCESNLCTFTAVYNFENGGWEYFAQGSVEVRGRVTHWMPLPEPPKQE